MHGTHQTPCGVKIEGGGKGDYHDSEGGGGGNGDIWLVTS
jgi:hypothetical protein